MRCVQTPRVFTKMLAKIVSPLFILLTCCAVTINSYNVLIVFPMASRSHDILARSIIKEVLSRGHEVTYISAYPRNDPIPNLREIDVSYILQKPTDHERDHVTAILNGTHYKGSMGTGVATMKTLTAKLLEHDTMRRFVADSRNRFDVVVVEWFNNEVLAGLSALYQCPLVWYSSLDIHSGISRFVDDVMNPSYSSHILSANVPPYSFAERAKSLWGLLEDLYYTASHVSEDTELYNKVFAEAAEKRGVTLPNYEELIYNASLLLLNSHPSISTSARLPQNAKSIGGHHIEVPTKPLAPYLQNILDESEYGVIYFSLGSVIPEEIKLGLLKLFGGLKETVLWRYEEHLQNTPSNVHVLNWMPQHAILEHPNTKLFITHGGMLSTTEAIHYGVPVIGIPLFGDQFLNMARAEKKGYATTVQFTWNLAEDLSDAIGLVVGNPKYAATAKSLSELYHLRPQRAGAELAFWLEYVIKTKGAPHLRSPALMLPWYQRFYVDFIASILAVFLVLCLILRYVFRFLMGLCGTKQKED